MIFRLALAADRLNQAHLLRQAHRCEIVAFNGAVPRSCAQARVLLRSGEALDYGVRQGADVEEINQRSEERRVGKECRL